MELNKSIWTEDDINDFQELLLSLGGTAEQRAFEAHIVNTILPCIAVPSAEINRIVREIANGNFTSFIDLWIWEYHSNTTILSGLISKVKNFEQQKEYLRTLARRADNWATTDAIKLKPNKNTNLSAYVNFARELTRDDKTFARRLGLIILLKLSSENAITDDIFDISDSLADEKEYYVNMANAWLICEMFIKHRDSTLKFIENTHLNAFTVNKAISKCRDSYRVSDEDKTLLLTLKRKA